MGHAAADSPVFADEIRSEVEKALKHKRLSGRQASLAAVGNDGLIRDIRAGRSISAERLAALASVLDLELYFGQPRSAPPEPPTLEIDSDDFAAIPRVAVEASAGAGAFVGDAPEVVGKLAFRTDWLRRIGVRPDRAMLITVTGDSMAPALGPGDLALIDLDRADWEHNSVSALVDLDGGVRIKRVLLDGRRGLVLVSDNAATHPPEVRLGPDAARLRCLGRVVWSGHRWE